MVKRPVVVAGGVGDDAWGAQALGQRSGIGGGETLLTAGVIGLGVAVGAAALLAWMVRRRA